MDIKQLFDTITPSGNRLVYVTATGSDSNPGTQSLPYASINRALAVALPGDRILVGAGTYAYTEARNLNGRRDAWIVVQPLTPSATVIVSITTTTDNFFNIIGSQFVAVYGLEIFGNQNNSNTNGSGISIFGNSHHIRVWNCHIHDFPGGGINCFDVGGSHDMLDLCFNRIHATSRYSPNNTSGISIFASRDLTGGETWPDGHAYRIVGNYIYDVVCTVPFTPGGFNYVTDGNAISLDLIYDTYGYTKPIIVEGNLLSGCGARGMHAYGTINVDCVNNTVVGNIRTTGSIAITNMPDLDSQAGGVAQTAAQALSVRITGNVIYPTNTPNWADARSYYADNVILGGTQAVTVANIDRRTTTWAYFTGSLSTGAELVFTPVTSWIPATPDSISRPSGTTGWQLLATAPRPVLTWSAGAVDRALVAGGGSGAAITTKDEGVTLTANTTQYDFTGTGVTATAAAGNVTVAIPGGTGINPALITAKGDLIGGTGASAPATIPKTLVNGRVLTFDTSGSSSTNIKWADVPYGSMQDEGVVVPVQSTLNFIGAGVTATDDSVNLRTNVTIPGSSSGSQIAYTVGGYTGATTGYVPIPADGSGPYTVTLTQNTSIRISDVTSESWTRIEVVIKQDATGGWAVEFAPGTIHWVGNTSSHFDSNDSNWSYGLYPPGAHYAYPIIDPTPYSATIIRLTWMGSLLGYMGEVVTHIQPLYTVMPTTWLNSISGTTVTVGLPVRTYRGMAQSSINTFMDLLTDPAVCSAATRTAMGNHGGTYDFCRQGITDTLWYAGYRPNYEYAGANVVGSDGKVHSALSSPGFGPPYNATYPPDWGIGISYGGVWHEGSHLEDAMYYATNGNPEGTTYITQLTTVVNVFNACYSITTVGMIVFMTGTVTGGTFTLMFKDSSNTFQTTSAIAWNATAATVQAALAALPNIGTGNVVCSGGPLPNTQILVQFQGSLPAFQPNTLMLGNDNNRRYSPQSLMGTTPLVRTGRNEPNGASKSEWYAEMRKYQRYTRAGGAYTNPDSQLPDYQSSQTDMVGWSRSGPAGYVLPSDRTGAFNTYMNTIIPIP